MPCYVPLRGVLFSGPQGRRLEFSRSAALGGGKVISLPCGRCIGCRLERSRQWAVRIMHESKMHDENSFLTLTYDDAHLPPNNSLVVEHCQLFLKRLRKALEPRRIRFFLCGEYGEKTFRPHYHAIIFGYSFPDKKKAGQKGDFTLWESKLLSDAWGYGGARIGHVSFESASYVANYATKKIIGSREVVNAHYRGRRPEFLLMSRRPGIGRAWIDKFESDVYPSDEVIVRGKKARPPRYYDQVFASRQPIGFEGVRSKRQAEADRLEKFVHGSGYSVDVAPSRNARRLQQREAVARAKLSLKRRSLGE